VKGSALWLRRLCWGAIAAVGLALLPVEASAATTLPCPVIAGGVIQCTGQTTEKSGLTAKYLIEVPPGWNQTLVLYSHGYDSFTVPNPPTDNPGGAGESVIRTWLLSHGYALAGSAYARAGWSVQQLSLIHI